MFKNIIIIGLVILVIILSSVIYYFWSELKEVSQQLELTKKELAAERKLPSPEILPEDLEPGTVGEEGAPAGKLPTIVSNTSGIIKEVGENRIIVAGSGSNFADQKPRDLTLLFTSLTVTTITTEAGGQTRYQGLEGLEYLKPGIEISISGDENIRGRTEFRVRFIRKI